MPRRFISMRFRYSLRTILVAAILASCYFACARPTKTTGVRDLCDHVNPQEDLRTRGSSTILPYFVPPPEASYVVPLVVRFPTTVVTPEGYEIVINGSHDHYLWLFGWIVPLPC
ncbi:hypothetical protein [Rubripirellula obstinata]|nr:hypothetical protein [Rubripirellula obstinata]